MMFFFRRPTIHLDCFTSVSDYYEFSPIVQARNYYPDWWRKLPKIYRQTGSLKDVSTMKRCRGFIDWYDNAVILPMWSDVNIMISDNRGATLSYEWNSSDSRLQIHEHDKRQYDGLFAGASYSNMKFVSPWCFKTKEHIKFDYSPVFWNSKKAHEIIVMPGIIDFKYQTATNLNCLVEHRQVRREINLRFNDPMAIIRPLDDRKLKFKNHLVDEYEFKKLSNWPQTWYNRYFMKKKIIMENERKCPFGFGK